MNTIAIDAVGRQLTEEGVNHQVRDDGKIVFGVRTECFKDDDGDPALFTVIEIPYPNVLTISCYSLFSLSSLQSNPQLLGLLALYNLNSPVGCFSLSKDSGKVYWRSTLYTDGCIEQVSLHVKGALENILSFLDHKAATIGSAGNLIEESGDNSPENLLVDRLEKCLEISVSEEQARIQPSKASDGETKEDTPPLGATINLSPNLSDECREFAESNIDRITSYLSKVQLELPPGLSLQIQHGNDMKDVAEGPNKGPYLVVVDSSGKEKRSAKLFLSKRGNLNHYIGLSTMLGRA